MLSLKPRPFVQSFFDMYGPRQPHAVTKQLSASFFVFVCFFFFVYLEMSLFLNIFVPVAFSLCIENKYMVCPPPLPDDVFLPCDERLFFYISLIYYVRIQSIKQSSCRLTRKSAKFNS